MGALDMTAKRDLLALLGRSAGDYLDGWFESDPIKAVYGFDGIVGNYASPYTPGSGYVLLHHRVRRGERQEGRLGPCHRRHGRDHPGHGQGLRRARRGDPHRRAGARSDRREGAAPSAWPARMASLSARRTVVSNLNPKLLFQQLVDPALLPADFRERIARYRMGSGTFRMNVALSRTAALHLPAGSRRSPDRRHHHRAQPGLYGPRLSRCARTQAGRRSRSSRC